MARNSRPERPSMRRSRLAVGFSCAAATAVHVVGFQLQDLAISRPSRHQRRQHGVEALSLLPKKVSLCASRLTDGEREVWTDDTLTDVPGSSARSYRTTDELNSEIRQLCKRENTEHALKVLLEVENLMAEDSADCVKVDQASYVLLMNGFSDDASQGAAEAEKLLRHMETVSNEHPCCTPQSQAYSAVILAWSKSTRNDSARKADALLTELWSRYNATDDRAYLPTRATYISTITAWARSGMKRRAAERAEELLEEMEAHRTRHPRLSPNAACVNTVLNAWSKSRDRLAADRCEAILQRMENLARRGRHEVRPSTISFNTAIDTIARSEQRDAPRRAEEMLKRMDELSRGEEDATFPCKPDTLSFNVVINSWAKSREPAAARRAEAILRHMERQHESGETHVQPDAATYNSVIHAWSRSKEEDAPVRAATVMKRMESSFANGNKRARPDVNSYNSMINVWAKSKHPDAGERAQEILNQMKRINTQEDGRSCRPDIFTYTSTIDCLAKSGSDKAAEQAIALLAELEMEYETSRETCIQPNVRTYTSAINAIARSRKHPERAAAILDRLERQAETGETGVRPDAVCYNAVINAFGWSNEKGKAVRSQEVFTNMLDQYKSGNLDAKPDIVTCNSILNACAFDPSENETDRARTTTIAVQTLEAFQAQAPTYGWPNHSTYGNMLLAIARQMPMTTKRLELAEATFYQCCQAGHVSSLVVSQLRNAVDSERLKAILGSALIANDSAGFRYDMNKVPYEWRKYAPQPKERVHRKRRNDASSGSGPSRQNPGRRHKRASS